MFFPGRALAASEYASKLAAPEILAQDIAKYSERIPSFCVYLDSDGDYKASHLIALAHAVELKEILEDALPNKYEVLAVSGRCKDTWRILNKIIARKHEKVDDVIGACLVIHIPLPPNTNLGVQEGVLHQLLFSVIEPILKKTSRY